MSDDVQVTMFLRPDTRIRTFDSVHPVLPDLRVVGVHIGGMTMHLPSDDGALFDTATRLIDALGTLRLAALDRLNPLDPPEPKWLHESVATASERHRLDPSGREYVLTSTGWTEPERREAWGK